MPAAWFMHHPAPALPAHSSTIFWTANVLQQVTVLDKQANLLISIEP